jgi:hypothetical protein
MVPYWVSQSPSQETFLRSYLSKPCSECEVDFESRLLGMGSLTYKGLYRLIYGCLCRGCDASFVFNPTFFQALCHLIYYSPNIEYYMQGKVKSTAMPLEATIHLLIM